MGNSEREPQRADWKQHLGLALIVAAPPVVWITRDHGVWPWDTAHMGNYTLNLWAVFNPFSPAWWRELLTGMVGKAPGLPWLSQPFAGLGEWIWGDALTGLLAFQVLVQILTATLILRTALHATGGQKLAAWFGALLFVAAPLSMGLSVRYYTEPLQTLCVAYAWWAVITIPRAEFTRRGVHLLLAATLGSITKVSTPLYLVVPLLWVVIDSARAAQLHPWLGHAHSRRRLAWLAAGAVAVAVLSLTWLVLGFRPLFEFVRSTSSGAIAAYYGEAQPFLVKLSFWLRAIVRELLPGYVLIALGAAGLVHLVCRREAVAATSDSRRWVFLIATQAAVVLAVVALQVNQDVRYLEPLLPGFCIMAALAAGRLRPNLLTALPLTAAAACYFFVAVQLLGWAQLPWLRGAAQLHPPQPVRDGQQLLEHTVTALRRFGGPGRTYLVAVDVINFNTNALELHTARQRLAGEPPIQFRAGFSPLFGDFDYISGRLLSGEHHGIITLAPADVPPPAGMENQSHGRVFELLNSDRRFTAIAAPELAPVRLFRLVGALQPGAAPAVSAATDRRKTDQITIDEIGGRPVAHLARDRGVFVLPRTEAATLRGWAFADTAAPPPEDAYVEISDESGQQVWHAQLTRGSRPDVATHFNAPGLERSGFSVRIDPSELPPGLYRLRVLQVVNRVLWEPDSAIYWLEVR